MEKIQKNTFRRNYYNSDDSGKVFLAALLVPTLISLLLALVVGAVASINNIPADELGNQIWYMILCLLVAPIGFCSVYLIYNKVAKISYRAINLRPKISWKTTLICLAIAIVALFGIQYFISCMDFVLVNIGYKLDLLGLPLDNVGWLVVNVLLVALLPAIFEEIIFRGIILQGLRKTLSDSMAIVLSALMFAIMHTSLQQFIYPFLLGLILAWVATRTGSTFASMIIHFTNNFLVVLIAFIQNVTGVSIGLNPANWWVWLVAILLLVVTGFIMFVIDRFYFKHKNEREEEKFVGSKLSIFIWISIIVGIILLILSIIVNFTQR